MGAETVGGSDRLTLRLPCSIGEYSIPKGARVVINLWSVHHDEKEWDKPEEFNPGGLGAPRPPWGTGDSGVGAAGEAEPGGGLMVGGLILLPLDWGIRTVSALAAHRRDTHVMNSGRSQAEGTDP